MDKTVSSVGSPSSEARGTGSRSCCLGVTASTCVLTLAAVFFSTRGCRDSSADLPPGAGEATIDTKGAAALGGGAGSLEAANEKGEVRQEVIALRTAQDEEQIRLPTLLDPKPDIYQRIESLVRIAEGYSQDSQNWRWFSDLRVCDLSWGVDHSERRDLALVGRDATQFASASQDPFEPFSRSYYRSLIEQINSSNSDYSEKELFAQLVNSYERLRNNPRMELYIAKLLIFHISLDSLDREEFSSLANLRARIINSEGEEALGRLTLMAAIAEKRMPGLSGWLDSSRQSTANDNVPVSRSQHELLDRWVGSDEVDLGIFFLQEISDLQLKFLADKIPAYVEDRGFYLTQDNVALIELLRNAANSGVFSRKTCEELVGRIPVELLDAAIVKEITSSDTREFVATRGDSVHLLLAPLFIQYGNAEQKTQVIHRSLGISDSKPEFSPTVVSLLVERVPSSSWHLDLFLDSVRLAQLVPDPVALDQKDLDIITLLRTSSSRTVGTDDLVKMVFSDQLDLDDRLEILNFLLNVGKDTGTQVVSEQRLANLCSTLLAKRGNELLMFLLLSYQEKLPADIATVLSDLVQIKPSDSTEPLSNAERSIELDQWVTEFIRLRLLIDDLISSELSKRDEILEKRDLRSEFLALSSTYLGFIEQGSLRARTKTRIIRAIEEFNRAYLSKLY